MNTSPENSSENSPKTPALSLPEVTFEQLPERLQKAATNANWTTLTPVQAKAIPYLFAKKDMMIQARTGSGKTGAFVLPMLELLNPRREVCQALILVPTRELAKQVSDAADTLFAGSGLRTVAVYGGVGYGPQTDALKNGAHIVVGTPGRVLDHLLRRTLSLGHLEMLIFDEADRMLSMGFFPDMIKVKRYLPARRVHTCMFSATFPIQVMNTAQQFMREPEHLSLSTDHIHVTETAHLYYFVPGMDKDRALVRIIEVENPTSAIIFCNTKVKVHYVTVVLQRFGYDADELSADLSQAERERVLNRVRAGTLRLLVATDVAARGLDIPELSHVFQYEPPDELEAYIHRAGRTGRAGATGVAITLVSGTEKFALDRISKRYNIPIEERPLPSDEDVEAIVAQRLTALLEARLRDRDRLQTERSQRFIPLARELAENVSELPLITMLLDDYYQQSLHAPVMPPEEKASSQPKSSLPRRSRPNRRRR
ncbi:MAG: DEAD/DEAH box helicase [Anaerolineales bacterium]